MSSVNRQRKRPTTPGDPVGTPPDSATADSRHRQPIAVRSSFVLSHGPQRLPSPAHSPRPCPRARITRSRSTTSQIWAQGHGVPSPSWSWSRARRPGHMCTRREMSTIDFIYSAAQHTMIGQQARVSQARQKQRHMLIYRIEAATDGDRMNQNRRHHHHLVQLSCMPGPQQRSLLGRGPRRTSRSFAKAIQGCRSANEVMGNDQTTADQMGWGMGWDGWGWDGMGTNKGPAAARLANFTRQAPARASVRSAELAGYDTIQYGLIYTMRRAHCRPQPAPGVPFLGSISAMAPLPFCCGQGWSMGRAVRTLAPTSSPVDSMLS